MLYILTGDVQIGKTRALERHCDELIAGGTQVYGVLSPGIWRTTIAADGQEEHEKLGIETLLLPSGERFAFAQRSDLARQAGTANAESQSSAAGLHWAIDDVAIERINQHFAGIAQTVAVGGEQPGLLVVDELGQLELNRDQGFTEAVKLLQVGPTALYADALIIVREWLVPQALSKFEDAWGSPTFLSPTPDLHLEPIVILGA